MADKDLSWKYAEDFVVEPDAVQAARQAALEHGVDPVTPAVGAQLAVLAAAGRAETIVEVGTGGGVSGLWLLLGAPEATLTSIDIEVGHQELARSAFAAAGIPTTRTRLISGRALEVLPRLNDGAYDLVFIDADPASVLDYVQHGLRIARPGGVVVVAHALWHDRVADPAQRGDVVADHRALLATIAESAAVTSALSTAGDGLLQLVKTGE